MILGIDQLVARLKAHYDKVLAFAVLLFLVFSLIILGVRVGLIRQMKEDFDLGIASLRAENPNASQIESTVFDETRSSLENPFQIELDSTNTYMFVPETRFSCRDCRLPVPLLAKNCPHCNATSEPIVAENPDPDGDGMPTDWEKRYGFDHTDPNDAAKDNDGDGYSNLIEYKEGFDPTDPKSHPAAIEKLKLIEITGEKLGLRFKSRLRTGTGYKYSLNYKLPSGDIKTDFVSIGDVVAGVTIVDYKEIKVVVEGSSIKKDQSELTVRTEDGELIKLVTLKAAGYTKLTAHLVLTLLDGSERKIDVAKNDEFEIEDIKYKVIAIDDVKSRVIIHDVLKKKKIVIQNTSNTEE